PALADRITEASYLWHNWRISLTDGTVLFDLPLTQVAEGPGWRIRWSELYRVLRGAAGPSVSYGCEITDIGRDAGDTSKTSIAWAQGGRAHRLDDIVCDNGAETHWARMQEHELLYRAADCNVLYLGDAAHGMVPTLGQGATQALEDASNAAALITERYRDGKRGVADWLVEIEA